MDQLVRTSKLDHPLKISVETPLLVPSFSSKGFGFKSKDESEVADALRVSKAFLTDSVLFSAYDFFHNHIPGDEEFKCTELTFIDSGGYETSEVFDLSVTAKYNYPIKEWSVEQYESVIDSWPEHKAGIIISYDHGKERHSLEEQITNARKLFDKYPAFLSDFLIKPETEGQRYVQIENVIRQIEALKPFSIIGVTEKEIGNTILNRMKNIAKIRRALNASTNVAPIHVFGSLDPISSLLYFLAGAEIFDGLTWLKFSYYKSTAIYQSNFGILGLDGGLTMTEDVIRSNSMVQNLYYLTKMRDCMKAFSVGHDFKVFNKLHKNLGEHLEDCYNKLQQSLN